MNLLVKEIYRVYEKIVTTEYQSTQSTKKVNDFLNWSYEQKVPLYLLMVFSEQKLLVDKLFDIGKELSVSLIEDSKNFDDDPEDKTEVKTHLGKPKTRKLRIDKQKRFINSFVNFVDPFT